MANVRIKDLTTDSALAAGDYVVIDSASEGSRKFDLGTELANLKEEISELGGLSDDVKTALLQIAQKVAYIDDDGQDYYDALYDALYPDVPPTPKTLVSISAVYTQSGTVYDTDTLDSLKADLVVTATYDDSTTETVTAYTLSGTLEEGTSTITVAYGGKTAEFDVTVSISLDSIAFGTLTYRQIFITNNLFPMGDFESAMTEDANFHDADVTGYQYKIRAAGTPTRSTSESVSPTHSLKAFGSTSQQMFYKSETKSLTNGEKFLICASVKVDRYTKGYAGVQVISPINNSVDNAIAYFQRTTTGFETTVAIFELTANRTGIGAYVGSWSSANLDCYVDDAIITPLPSGLSVEDATTLYNKYLGIRRTA